MGKVVETKKKKKKGRPSLLDLQKRSIKQQEHLQQQHHQQRRNSNPYAKPNFNSSSVTANQIRRSTRRVPNHDGISGPSDNTEDGGEDDDELKGNRREKKLKFVLRLPSQRSSLNSTSLNSSSYGSDSNAEDDHGATNHKKRQINAIRDGSGIRGAEKGYKPDSSSNHSNDLQAIVSADGPSTSLPDKKLLLFVLDRLQKKDTYGVFSEPVDPEELPDYHEVIQQPMDFGTVRKKLASGVYSNLEQFEKDVYLICSNAMQYNARDTIYFRQARSIQELAKKNFENLRQDSDDNKPEPKIVRRGRPPTKHLKLQAGPSLERASSEFSDATLATGGENTTFSNYNLRKAPSLSDKCDPFDLSGRSLNGSRNSETYVSLLAEQKFGRSEEFIGSTVKGGSVKYGKKQIVLDENRRNTYKQSNRLAGGQKPSVLATFDREKKQLVAVGLHSEHGYARSLASFAANLGSVAWRIASRKIEKALPPGVKFGPGWVGEEERLVLPFQDLLQTRISPSAALPCTAESNFSDNQAGENSSEKHVPSAQSASRDGHLSKPFPPTASPNRSAEPSTDIKGSDSHPGFNYTNATPHQSVSTMRPMHVIHQNPVNVIRPGMNGFNGTYGFNLQAQGKLLGPSGFNLQCSRTNPNSLHPSTANDLNSEKPKSAENSNKFISSSSLPQPSWQGLSQQQRQDSVPPDLNVRFQSPGGSPSSSRVDTTQPDLALQL